MTGFQHDGLQCEVWYVGLDFKNKSVTIMIAEGECCDMSGCIAMVMAISPTFECIHTMSGPVPDTTYYKTGDEWVAVAGNHGWLATPAVQ